MTVCSKRVYGVRRRVILPRRAGLPGLDEQGGELRGIEVRLHVRGALPGAHTCRESDEVVEFGVGQRAIDVAVQLCEIAAHVSEESIQIRAFAVPAVQRWRRRTHGTRFEHPATPVPACSSDSVSVEAS